MYVVQRGNRYTGYYRHRGKRLSAGTYDTFKEAQRQSLQRELALATDPIEGSKGASGLNQTLSDYIESWLLSSDLQAITRKEYGRILRSYVLPIMGARQVTSISRSEVRELVTTLTPCVGLLGSWSVSTRADRADPRLALAWAIVACPTPCPFRVTTNSRTSERLIEVTCLAPMIGRT